MMVGDNLNSMQSDVLSKFENPYQIENIEKVLGVDKKKSVLLKTSNELLFNFTKVL